MCYVWCDVFSVCRGLGMLYGWKDGRRDGGERERRAEGTVKVKTPK